MADPINVLGISGSLRAKSYNTALLRHARRQAPEGMTIDVANIRDVPHYDGDVEERGFPDAVVAFREKFRRADALLVATPEYNFSVPGVLKNVFDWLSRPPDQTITQRKPVAIMGAGGRLGTARAQYDLRRVCGCLGMLPLARPEVFVINAWEKMSPDGSIRDPGVEEQVSALLVALADWVGFVRRGAAGP